MVGLLLVWFHLLDDYLFVLQLLLRGEAVVDDAVFVADRRPFFRLFLHFFNYFIICAFKKNNPSLDLRDRSEME